MTSLWKRLEVVVSGFGVGIGFSTLIQLPLLARQEVWSQSNSPNAFQVLLLFLSPAGGPLLGILMFPSDPQVYLWSVGLMALIALHPRWPRWETGIISSLAIACWFMWGFMFLYSSV
jgi:hypothetical protein